MKKPCKNEIDITGQRFGRLVAVEKSSQKDKHHGVFLWEFRCDCGTGYFGNKYNVMKGRITSCGCYRRDYGASKATDMSGQRFGTFVAVRRLPPTGGSDGTLWQCQCDCGHEFHALGRLLRNGQIRHCPACRKVRARLSPEKELAGTKFGRLYALYTASTCPRRGRIMRCVCECGSRTDVPLKYLRSGNTKSCGCLKAENRNSRPVGKIAARNRRYN